MKKYTIWIAAGLCAVFGLSYIKLCIIGWEDEWSLAVGQVRIEVDSQEDANLLSTLDDSFTTSQCVEVDLESGMVTGPPWNERHSDRLILDGHGIRARGRLLFNPMRIRYEAESEDSEIMSAISDLAAKRGVKSKLNFTEINTPIDVVTNTGR